VNKMRKYLFLLFLVVFVQPSSATILWSAEHIDASSTFTTTDFIYNPSNITYLSWTYTGVDDISYMAIFLTRGDYFAFSKFQYSTYGGNFAWGNGYNQNINFNVNMYGTHRYNMSVNPITQSTVIYQDSNIILTKPHYIGYVYDTIFIDTIGSTNYNLTDVCLYETICGVNPGPSPTPTPTPTPNNYTTAYDYNCVTKTDIASGQWKTIFAILMVIVAIVGGYKTYSTMGVTGALYFLMIVLIVWAVFPAITGVGQTEITTRCNKAADIWDTTGNEDIWLPLSHGNISIDSVIVSNRTYTAIPATDYSLDWMSGRIIFLSTGHIYTGE
jgi:hypothetical protein